MYQWPRHCFYLLQLATSRAIAHTAIVNTAQNSTAIVHPQPDFFIPHPSPMWLASMMFWIVLLNMPRLQSQ